MGIQSDLHTLATRGHCFQNKAAPGFGNVIIKPAVVGDVTWVNAHHDSPYGPIVSNWKCEGGRLTMEVAIPANATGAVFVPGKRASAKGLRPVREEGAWRYSRSGRDAIGSDRVWANEDSKYPRILR